MGERIRLKCETCYHIWDLPRTNELPEHIFFMHCNWCPKCEDQAQTPYEEWWEDNENGDNYNPPIPVCDNQLTMPFIFDELEINKPETINA